MNIEANTSVTQSVVTYSLGKQRPATGTSRIRTKASDTITKNQPYAADLLVDSNHNTYRLGSNLVYNSRQSS